MTITFHDNFSYIVMLWLRGEGEATFGRRARLSSSLANYYIETHSAALAAQSDFIRAGISSGKIPKTYPPPRRVSPPCIFAVAEEFTRSRGTAVKRSRNDPRRETIRIRLDVASVAARIIVTVSR